MPEEFGFKNATPSGDNLRSRLMQSPTGRQLAIDGNLIAPLFASNPALNDVNVPPQCTFGFYINGADLWMSSFTRETGWVSVQLS